MKPQLTLIEGGESPEEEMQKVLHQFLALSIYKHIKGLQETYPLLDEQGIVSALRDWFLMETANKAFDLLSIKRSYTILQRLLHKFERKTSNTIFADGYYPQKFEFREGLPPKLSDYIEANKEAMKKSYLKKVVEATAEAMVNGEVDFDITHLIESYRTMVMLAIVGLLDEEGRGKTMAAVKECGLSTFLKKLPKPTQEILKDPEVPGYLSEIIAAARERISPAEIAGRTAMAQSIKSTRFRPVVIKDVGMEPEAQEMA